MFYCYSGELEIEVMQNQPVMFIKVWSNRGASLQKLDLSTLHTCIRSPNILAN